MNPFRGFGKRHLLIALGFSLVVQLAHVTYALIGKDELKFGQLGLWTGMLFLISVVGLACAVATDNLLGGRAGTAKRLLISLAAASLFATAWGEVLLTFWPEIAGKEHLMYAGAWHRLASHFATAAGWAMLLIGLYTMLQASRRATERLHTAQLSAIATERHMVEADLRAMQARVEPDLLFAALQAVDQAYARSVDEGERALDALISFLRAALPADASGNSTVAAEVELVRAYLALVELVSASRLKLEVAVEAPAQARAMPAMLLLPLVRWVLGGAAQASLSMDARVRAERLEVTLHSAIGDTTQRHAQAGEKQDISGLQDRLARLFAGRALLEASPGPDGRGARLEIPLFA
jgi:hypothetical protein